MAGLDDARDTWPGRREVLLGAACMAGLAMAHPSFAAPSARFYRVIVDARFPEAIAFAAGRSDPVRRMRHGDLTRIWSHDLEPRLSQGPVALAGMTGAAALACLELMVRRHGMRVLHRAERPSPGADKLISWVIGPVSMGAWS